MLIKYYTAECDSCGVIFIANENKTSFVSTFLTKEELISSMENSEWSLENGCFCPECKELRMKQEDSNFEIDGLP